MKYLWEGREGHCVPKSSAWHGTWERHVLEETVTHCQHLKDNQMDSRKGGEKEQEKKARACRCVNLGADKDEKYRIGKNSKWGKRKKLIEGRKEETEGERWDTEARGMRWDGAEGEGTSRMMRQEKCRKLMQAVSKSNVEGGMRQNKERNGGKKKVEGIISDGTQQEDLALNHRRSWIKQIILSFSVSIPLFPSFVCQKVQPAYSHHITNDGRTEGSQIGVFLLNSLC